MKLVVARNKLRVSSPTVTCELGTAMLLAPGAGVPKIAGVGEIEGAILARIGHLMHAARLCLGNRRRAR